MTQKNHRLAFRLRAKDMEAFEALQAHYGESQAGTFRTLLTVKTDQERLLKRAEKTTDEIRSLHEKIDSLSEWLRSRVD